VPDGRRDYTNPARGVRRRGREVLQKLDASGAEQEGARGPSIRSSLAMVSREGEGQGGTYQRAEHSLVEAETALASGSGPRHKPTGAR
jgi:hypothetical protein